MKSAASSTSWVAGWRLGASTFAECVPQACELFLQRSTSLLGGGGSFLGRGGSLLGLAAGSHLEVKKLVGRVGIEDSVVPGTHAVPLFRFSASAERAPQAPRDLAALVEDRNRVHACHPFPQGSRIKSQKPCGGNCLLGDGATRVRTYIRSPREAVTPGAVGCEEGDTCLGRVESAVRSRDLQVLNLALSGGEPSAHPDFFLRDEVGSCRELATWKSRRPTPREALLLSEPVLVKAASVLSSGSTRPAAYTTDRVSYKTPGEAAILRFKECIFRVLHLRGSECIAPCPLSAMRLAPPLLLYIAARVSSSCFREAQDLTLLIGLPHYCRTSEKPLFCRLSHRPRRRAWRRLYIKANCVDVH
jgi:hypothetical protein